MFIQKRDLLVMRKIAIFMPPLSQYSVLHHFTKSLHNALQQQGIETRLLEAKYNDPAPFLDTLLKDPPDCTLSFNGLLPDEQGRFLSDMIHIPHVACLVDSPINFLPLIRSPHSIITCVDRDGIDFFNGLGFQNAFFMPHAVESSLAPDLPTKREYDVLMLSSCIDYEEIRNNWKKKYPKPLREALEEAAEQTLSDQETPYYQAFVAALDKQVSKQSGIDPSTIDFIACLDDLEMFIRGKDRVELVKAVQDAKVDIFGSAEGLTGWKKYLGNKRNVAIHDPVPFDQALATMKHSKIVLNSSPWIKNGGHERIFSGLACGALVITNENIFMREQFKDGDSIVFYQHNKWDKANHRVNEYLANVEKREQIIQKGRQLVEANHTWNQRAAQLIRDLAPRVEQIRRAQA
jgi:spore maturation protein CgeB